MTRNHYRLVCELAESDETVAGMNASIKRNDTIVQELQPLVKHVEVPKALWYKTNPDSELVLVENDGKTEIGILSGHSPLVKSMNVGYLRFVYADKSDAAAARAKFKTIVEGMSRAGTKPVREPVPEEGTQDVI